MNVMVRNRRVFTIVVSGVLAIGLSSGAAAQTLAPDDVVLWTAGASPAAVRGDWVRESDTTAAGGIVLRNPDRGRTKGAALAAPANYFEMQFTAKASTAYHLWIRMRAEGNSTNNDSVYVQFSDAVTATGVSTFRIGSTSAAEAVLQTPSLESTLLGWGWTDNGWGSLGAPIYFAAGGGAHVIRIQQREDGATIDQIVLSPVTFAQTAPGPRRSDTKILARALGLAPSVSSATAVIRVASAAAGRMFGTWQLIADATAAGAQALRNPNANMERLAPALSNPASYFEATFTAAAGKPYHVWVRMRADGNSLYNDSVHVQFNDSQTSASTPTARIGTSSSLEVVLQDGATGPAPHAWGWAENGWGALGSHVYFATTGTHTIRVQQREDGATIDQIVISPDTFLASPPGWRRDDMAILQAGTAPPPSNLPPTVSLTAPANGAIYAVGATVTLTAAASASGPENQLSKVAFYSGSTLLGTDTSAPYSYAWTGAAAGTYALKAVAYDSGGAQAASASVTITVGSANQPPTVTLTAPANGSTFSAPATITLSATASDPEGRLAKVDFYNGSILLATDTTAPFSFAWTGVGAGTYQLKAVATDANGGSASSATATVTIGTSTVTTRRVAFTASVNHATVTNYLLEVFPPTANTATAIAIASSDLGKPTPSSTNEIIVDRTTFLNNLAPGTYLITVASVSSGGKSRSTAISFTH
jgi:hypothetical protein